jgi:arsenite-transporting ATPase
MTTTRLGFLAAPPRILFFTGKGGVGKTSIACASALHLAERGKRVLLISTDPASNLDEVLGTALGGVPTAVAGVPGLEALNIDPQAAAQAYRDSVVGPLRGVLPASALRSIEEGLSGACTTEIAAFDRFCQLLTDPQASAEYDHLLFDTAPTGHTLRLLKLPAAWDSFLDSNTTGSSCIGPLAGLATKQATYECAVATLGDAVQTLLVLVSRPDVFALREAARTAGELRAEGIANQHLVINRLFVSSGGSAEHGDDPVARAMARRAAEALAGLPEALAAHGRSEVPLAGRLPMGLDGLRALISPEPPETAAASGGFALARDPLSLNALIDALDAAGRGVVMTAGKGGVGKTTLAAAIAVGLARRGHAVLLSTTDPAAHLAFTLEGEGGHANIDVRRIDPAVETAAYQAEVMAHAGATLDERGKALLEEDLRSPCTEEIAVFRAFARTVAAGEQGFVVLDTAPTGHTLLLLDAAEAYHRDVERNLPNLPDEVRRLLPRLRDPEFTRIVLVTLPEATPVHEAAKLRDDLQRAGITPWAWLINQSLHGHALTEPVLVAKQRSERPYINEVLAMSARVALLRWQLQAPAGVAALRELA